MARQEINLGALPNGVGGDTPRVANTKINDMTEEVYERIATVENSLSGKIEKTSVGAPDGVASLDHDGKVPSTQLPSAPAGPSSTDDLPEGSTNQYFTQSRVRSTTLAGLGALVNAAIVAGDTLLQAFAKLQGQLNAKLGKSDVAADSDKLGGQPASYYTATMAGATASADGVKGLVPAPAIADKDRFLKGDGSYGDVGGLPVGSLVPWHISEASLPPGHIPANGQVLQRSMWPDLWAKVAAVAVTDAQWLGDAGLQSRWSAGDGSTTFRAPDINGKVSGGLLPALVLRGYGRNSSAFPGNAQLDMVQDFKYGFVNSPFDLYASATGYTNPATNSGSVRSTYVQDAPGASVIKLGPVAIDGKALRVGPETRAANVAVIWCFIGGTVAINPGTVDITATAAQVTAQASQIQNLQAKSLALVYESAQTAWANGAVNAFTHGVTGSIRHVDVVMICIKAELVYAVGDSLRPPDYFAYGSTAWGHMLSWSSTQIGVLVGASGLPTITTNGAQASSINPANWRMIVRAYQ